MLKRLIGIINSGGDCSGINAVISSVVRTGLNMGGFEFVGFYKGWEGLLSPMNYIKLDADKVRGISHLGGTILQTVNKGRFAGKKGAGEVNEIPAEILAEAKANAEKIGIDSLVVIGGDGTLSAALQLQNIGVNIVGVPKSIDNDLESTSMTFGFQTSVDIVTDALRKLDSTAASHNRVMILETMGRYTGWIALYGGLGGSAQMILLPEMPYDIDKVIKHLRTRKEKGLDATIIVIAEGAMEKDGATQTGDGKTPEVKFTGASQHLMDRIETVAPSEFEMRNVVLGHLQRGGEPSSFDKILAFRYGVSAMQAIADQKFGNMTRLEKGEISLVPIKDAVKGLKRVDPDSELVKVSKSIGISFGI